MEEEWNQTSLDLQLAREQVGDLSLKVTVLTAGKSLKCFTKAGAVWNPYCTHF